mmetsp:Transcript_17046/g.57839  ORF Transcript_17046/g.57839 Transcript_17046/m.57839 type:complete len:158 (-) Transcript_17046:79-552(-)
MPRVLVLALALLLPAAVAFVPGRAPLAPRAARGRELEMIGLFNNKASGTKKGIVITVASKGQPPMEIQADGSGVNLRRALQSKGVEVYGIRGKLNNCGGGGVCGMCAVDVVEGMENLNPRSKNEELRLQGKPKTWRLSCSTKVTGPVTVVNKPGGAF